VGKVSDHLDIDWHDKSNINIHSIGFLDELANIYDFTKLLVLPDIKGEGIPIKTDEAIAAGVPFVATRHAMRGFEAKELKGDYAANAQEMITTIDKRLASNDVKANDETLKQLYTNHSFDNYKMNWDDILA
jgi:glycosyltransferase involved in cell wall biosynthesis